MEMPLVPVLAQMEQVGITLDTAFFEKFSEELLQRQEELQNLICQAVGYNFNINSTQQLSTALFENLGLTPPTKKKPAAVITQPPPAYSKPWKTSTRSSTGCSNTVK